MLPRSVKNELNDETYNHNMGSNSNNVSGKTSPESSDAFTSCGFHCAINEVLVWKSSVGVLSLLLKLGLDVIERQTHSGSNTSRDQT